MNEGWLELESDPGLFTLLVEEFGVTGVQVEEIYDLQKPIEGPVFGFIFLFKWIEERRARRKMSPSDEAFVSDAEVVNSMFFAQQIVPNSCATHALLSVLLNCADINLGQTLLSLKTFSKNFTPESKGYAIGNVAQIAKAHNSHAHPEPKKVKEKQTGITTTNRNHEAFHFVSYVPINGRLFELDGLKPYPIDHGPWGDHEEWTEKFRRVIAERLENEGGSSDIRFNLMAVVADRRMAYEQRLTTLRGNKQVILDSLEQLMHVNRPHVPHQSKNQQSCHSSKKSQEEKPSKPATEKIKISETPVTTDAPSKEVSESASSSKPASESSVSKDAPAKEELSREAVASNDDEKGVTKEENEEDEVIEVGDGSQKDELMKKKKKTAKVKIKAAVIPQPYRLPAALDNHNYAKSPLESDEEVESSSEFFTESDTEETDGKSMSSSTSSSNSSSSSSGTEDTDSESSSEDKMEVESDAGQPEEGTSSKTQESSQEDKSDEAVSEPPPEAAEVKSEEKASEQEPEQPPPKTEGILKKQGGEPSEKSDSPALRVTFSDAHEEKEVDHDNNGDDDIEIIDSTVPADITKPLTIQTVFENGPPSPASSNYSTDTASEAGSAFNSPIRSVNHSRSVSPNSVKQIKFKEWKSNVISEARAKLEATIMEMDQKDTAAAIAKKIPVVVRQGAHMGTRSKVAKAASASVPQTRQSRRRLAGQASDKKTQADRTMAGSESDRLSAIGSSIPIDFWKPPRPSFLVSQNGKQPFAPRDLLELLKSVESEIEIYEQKLEDEMEKRHQYKIDDSRRTHNYDPFICTFLTMLAEQGKLSTLVEKHTLIKRRQGISLGQLQKSRKRDRRRPRSRPKQTKLK